MSICRSFDVVRSIQSISAHLSLALAGFRGPSPPSFYSLPRTQVLPGMAVEVDGHASFRTAHEMNMQRKRCTAMPMDLLDWSRPSPPLTACAHNFLINRLPQITSCHRMARQRITCGFLWYDICSKAAGLHLGVHDVSPCLFPFAGRYLLTVKWVLYSRELIARTLNVIRAKFYVEFIFN